MATPPTGGVWPGSRTGDIIVAVAPKKGSAGPDAAAAFDQSRGMVYGRSPSWNKSARPWFLQPKISRQWTKLALTVSCVVIEMVGDRFARREVLLHGQRATPPRIACRRTNGIITDGIIGGELRLNLRVSSIPNCLAVVIGDLRRSMRPLVEVPDARAFARKTLTGRQPAKYPAVIAAQGQLHGETRRFAGRSVNLPDWSWQTRLGRVNCHQLSPRAPSHPDDRVTGADTAGR